MSTELEKFLSTLKGCLDTQHSARAKDCVISIGTLVTGPDVLTAAEIEYSLDTILNTPNGLLAFLRRAIKTSGRFAKANEQIFDLFRRLIQQHATPVRKSAVAILRECIRFVQSSSASARERELATAVVQDLVVYRALDDGGGHDMAQLLADLLTVFDQRKLTNRFQQALFELVGLLARDFPECVSEEHQVKILATMMSVAEGQLLEESYPSLISLAGALQGLNHFLVNFAPPGDGEQGGADVCRRIYVLVKKLSDWDEAVKERHAFRNALALLERHSALFGRFLYADHTYWQNILTTKWIRSTVEDRKCGIYALAALHRELGRELLAREASEEADRDVLVGVLSYFMKYFKGVLMASGSKPFEVRIAIRGFGAMSGACARLMSEEFMHELLLLVMQRTEYVYLAEDKSGEQLEHLPDLVQALSEIMGHVRGLTGVQVSSLQNIVIGLIRDFHFLSTAHHELVVSSVMRTFDNLNKLGGGVLDGLLDKIILRGLVWSCSHTLVIDANQNRDESSNWKDFVTYKNYLPLWRGLLAEGNSHGVDRAPLIKLIYAQLMKNLFLILDKLNLSTRKRTFKDESGEDRELFFCDPNVDLVPVKPKDFHIFFNLVDLYQDLLRYNAPVREHFENWIPVYFDYMVKMAQRHPLVSGFVKLIDLGLTTAEHLQYFQHQQSSAKLTTVNLLVYFVEQQIAKGRNSIGELQLTCLRFVLSCPVILLESFLEDSSDLLEVFRIAFQIGKGILTLANVALGCVQRIIANDSPIAPETRERVLVTILPLLDSYLQTRDSNVPAPITSQLTRFQRKRSVNLSSAKIDKIKLQHALASSESELVKFQRRILLFLGDIEPGLCTRMVHRTQEEGRSERPLVLWDLDSNCSIALQLLSAVGVRPIIKLDTIIARVCTLAVGSSDRRTKVAACELLHALVLYIIGIQYQDKMTKLWTELCGHLLQLATDPDLAICQMFEPLIFQIIHYLTQPSKITQKGTEVLASCLMESISHPSDTGVRDLAARCIREFLLWTIKQTPAGQQPTVSSSSAVNLSVILEQLRTYSMDSNPHRRQGAALAFNNIYRILREEESHIERSWLNLYYVFSMNYVMTENFDSSATNLEQISGTINHLVRVLVERNDLFNRHNPFRVVPSAFGGGLLKDLVLWLFEQCSSREESYRHKCMDVFPRLAKAVAGCTTDREFIQKYLPDKTIRDICDNVNVIQGIANATTLQFIADGNLPMIANIYLWLEYFISTLDMYCWLLKGSLLQNPSWFMENSNLFASIRFFISLVACATMFNLMVLVRPEFVDESQTSVEFRICVDKIIKFNLLKCTITVRIVDLLSWIMHQSYYSSVPENFWEHPEVVAFMIDLIFEPQKIGFDFKSCQDTIAEYPKRIENLLDRVERFENLQFKEMLYEKISDKLTFTYQELSERLDRLLKLDTIGLEDSNNAKGILTIAKRYESYQSYFSFETNNSLRTISEQILKTTFDALKEQRLGELFQIALTPSLKRFASIVLNIAFKFMTTRAMEPLIDLLLSEVELRLFQQTGCSVRHGEHFVATFEEAVFDFVLDQFPSSFEKLLERLDEANFSVIVKLLCNFLEFNYQRKRSEITVLETITEAVLNKWTVILQRALTLQNKFAAVDLQLIELMSSVAMASPNPLDEIGRKATGFQQWLLNLIGSSQFTLELKSKAAFLLPTLVGDTDFDSASVSDALQKLQNQHFPLRSSEFAPNSVERISFENCIVGLLDAMVVSRSPVLLKAIINATAADVEHIAEGKIRSALGDYMKTQNSNQQCHNLKLIFIKFCDESLEPTIRLTVLKRFLISGLRMCNFEAISTFYKINIKKINNMIRSNYGQFGSGWEAEQALINRFGGYQLIELYVAVLPRDVILSDDCPVSKTLYGESGKTPGNKMITDFTKKAYASRSEVFLTPDTPTAELFRKYQCAAYRALAAIISNTKDDLQLYNVLLFRENSDKNEFIWRKLINCSENHLYDGFGQELEEYPKIKDKLVSIRRLSATSNLNANRFKYIEMTSVFESSLSQDVTKLDLNYSVVRTTQEASAVQADEFSQQLARKTSIALERSKINDHEVMATICAVIQHMHENKITPTPEGDRVAPPPWIKFLSASLRDQQQHKNVRLFLAKVIDNCRAWLKPYAATLVPPLMQVIVDECITTQLNTFVTDLYALILEWSDFFQPSTCDEISLASGLVRFLMRNCFHTRREVFRLNLELVKNLIERWKAVVSVPVQLLYDMIGPTQDPESAQNLCGLQLNAIVMANGLVPWTETSKFDFIRAIFRCLDSEKVAVYQPASELLGMCLGHLYPSGEEKEDERYQNEFLAKLIAMRKRQEKKFMDVVYGIHKAFPAIVDSFLAVITHGIPNASGASKKIFLEMLLSRVETYNEQVYRELVSLDLKGMLKDRSYQLLALHLINKSLALMSAENLEDIIESVILLTSNDQSDVRDVIYEIMIFIYENSLALLTDVAKQKLRKALLTGFTDADQALQNRIFDFWTDPTRFPSEIDARFQRILEDLYEPSQEMNFLGYATHILLDTAVRNPESKRRIFQHEYESDVKLKEYTIDTHWRQRNSFASAPLFVESQQRFLQAGDGSQMERRIRATQFSNEGNMFEPTQDPTTMTQSAAGFSLPTQNSLMFEVNPPMLDRRSKRVVVATSIGASAKSYESLRRRILKDKERSSRDQALRAIERHGYEAVRKAESHKMKQGEVVLYRRYRIGDFPDLLINSLALLMPLQALCRRDPPLARQVFVAVFSGILDEWEQTDRDSAEAIDSINRAIQKIFFDTKSCDPNLFGALVEVAMKRPKQFDLKPDSVATVACGANMMSMGVLYLENKLHEYDFPDQSIVSRGSSVTLEAIHWIKLAELYHGMNEYDVLGDIFSHKMDSDTRLKEAIELESKGFFYKARELYHRMLLENQSRIAEHNFCFQSYYNCFVQMGMWEDLVPILEQQLDGSSEEFWTDEWNMENMLPKYVHANTRLNLSGDERGRGFITLLDAWMRVPDRKEHLKTNFGEEIAMLQLASGEYAKAKLYADQVLLQFLEEWSYLDVLSDKLRIRKLLDIRKVSEVHTLGVLLGNPLQEKRIKKLVASWDSSHPSASDSPVIWDTLLAYRKFALNKLESQLEASTDDRLLRTNFVGQLTDALFATELRLLDASFEQNNLRFARKVIKRLDMVAEEQSERGFRWRIAQLKWRRISELESGNVQRMVANFKRIRLVVEDEGLQQYRAVRVEGLHELFRAGEDLREVLPRAPEASADELQRLLGCEESDLEAALGSFSLDCLRKSIEIANTGLLDNSDWHAYETTLLADCHYKLAQFCYDGLEKEPLGETLNNERHLITSLLASMQYGSKPARQLFPVLLQMPNLQDGTLHQCFVDASGPVPEWMFLRWIPQLLSYVDFGSDVSFLESILLRIGSSYPMALYYPAKFSHGEFMKRFPERTIGSFACKLMALLEFPRLDRFVQELSQVVVPCMKVSNVAVDLARRLSAGSDLTSEYRTIVLGLMKEAFPESEVGIGREHAKLIPFKSEWMKLLDFSPVSHNAEIWKCIEHIRKEMEKLVPRHSTLELRRFSPWLAEYHFNDREEMLELPGQYNVDYKPNVVNHVKIVKICNQLEMYKTLRKPLRVQINGSDGRSYDFLVKYGEDLRQDQRIQQLLSTISNQMSLDQHCKEHQLSVRTYEVVPIRSNFGIIGWIPNTLSIKSIAVRSMVRFNAAGDVTDTINREYNQFLLQTSGSTPDRRLGLTLIYGKTASACTPEKIMLKFNELRYKIKEDALKRALFEMAVSPESFFNLRANFARSLMAMNVACWILGIGDRHTSNVLIDRSSGRLAGVDFGIAFGAGARDQPIPEMVPFRLTPQFVSVMEPMRTAGLMHKCSVYTLACLRSSRKLLKSCLEVFVREPTLDWLEAARYRFQQDENKAAFMWDPQTRINIAIRKLNGANPKVLVAEELRLGQVAQNPEYLAGYLKLLQMNVPNMAEGNLSVEQQVECLLQMATSGSILGIAYAGWFPWF